LQNIIIVVCGIWHILCTVTHCTVLWPSLNDSEWNVQGDSKQNVRTQKWQYLCSRRIFSYQIFPDLCTCTVFTNVG